MSSTPDAPDMAETWENGFLVEVGGYVLGLAEASPESASYWRGVAQDRLLVKACACGALMHPRRIVCSRCGSPALEWREASGRGHVYTHSSLHRAPVPQMQPSVPYTLGIVELEEGVHLFTRFLAGDPSSIRIGAPAHVAFRTLETGLKLPVFVVEDGRR